MPTIQAILYDPLCNLHFKEGPRKSSWTPCSLIWDSKWRRERLVALLSLKYVCVKKSRRRLRWLKNVKVFTKEMTNSIKFSQNQLARSHGTGQHSPHQLVQNKVVQTFFCNLSFPIPRLVVDHATRPDCEWQIENNQIQSRGAKFFTLESFDLFPGFRVVKLLIVNVNVNSC